jgi:hypothetical protein
MIKFNRKIEFTAKTFNDIGKAIVIAGLVSSFFPNLPIPYRLFLGVLCFALILISILIYPENK